MFCVFSAKHTEVFMRKDRFTSLVRKYWFFVVVPVMLVVFFVFMRSGRHLDVYVPDGSNSEYTIPEQVEETEKKYGAKMWKSEKIPLEMPIPDGWSRVTKDGYDTFIHAASSSSIQVQILSYYPRVNSITADTFSADLDKRGYVLSSFERTGDTSYYASYSTAGGGGVTNVFEVAMWDRKNVVKLVVTVDDIYVDRLMDEIRFCLDNVIWNRLDPVPEGVFLQYMSYGDFEFGVPDTWTYAEAEGGFYATDENSGSVLTVGVVDENLTIEDINQYDYAQFMQNGRADFGMTRFEQYDGYIYAEAAYNSSQDGTLIDMLQIYGVSGGKARVLTFEFADEYASDLYLLCKSCMECYRTFETASEPETEVPSEPVTEAPKQSAEPSSEAGGTEETDETESVSESAGEPETETEYGDSVDTFASALVQVAEIPADRAQEISDLWTALNAGSPAYAQAVKESSTSVVVYVETAEGMKFYLTVGKDGILSEIRANAEDGAVMYQKQN